MRVTILLSASWLASSSSSENTCTWLPWFSLATLHAVSVCNNSFLAFSAVSVIRVTPILHVVVTLLLSTSKILSARVCLSFSANCSTSSPCELHIKIVNIVPAYLATTESVVVSSFSKFAMSASTMSLPAIPNESFMFTKLSGSIYSNPHLSSPRIERSTAS